MSKEKHGAVATLPPSLFINQTVGVLPSARSGQGGWHHSPELDLESGVSVSRFTELKKVSTIPTLRLRDVQVLCPWGRRRRKVDRVLAIAHDILDRVLGKWGCYGADVFCAS